MKPAEISEELSRNFHLFWDNFPFPVMLVRKDRTILDRNKAAEAVGCVPGNRCVDAGKKEDHIGCLANQALREQAGLRAVGYVEMMGMVLDSYWVPLAGEKDMYLHFSIDISEYAAERMFPDKCAAKSDCSGCTAA